MPAGRLPVGQVRRVRPGVLGRNPLSGQAQGVQNSGRFNRTQAIQRANSSFRTLNSRYNQVNLPQQRPSRGAPIALVKQERAAVSQTLQIARSHDKLQRAAGFRGGETRRVKSALGIKTVVLPKGVSPKKLSRRQIAKFTR